MERKVREHVAGVVAAILQQGGPFAREEIGIVRAAKQLVDDLRPLVRFGTGDERRRFGIGWQTSGDIERDAPQEGGIIANWRGGNPQLLEVRKQVVINEIADGRQTFDRCPQRNSRTEDCDSVLEPNHHRNLARDIERFDQPGACDFSHRGIVRFKHGPRGHITLEAIRVFGDGLELLLASQRNGSATGLHFESGQFWGRPDITFRPLANPLDQQRMIGRFGIEPFAAAVRHAPRGLQQQQAAFRRAGRQPPSAAFQRQMVDIFVWFVTEKRELEPVLAIACLGMADADIAARFREDREHFVDETDRSIVGTGARAECGEAQAGDAHRQCER